MATLRKNYLQKRRHRKEKLGKLREKYKFSKSNEEKELILQKVAKIAPYLTINQFLNSSKNS